MRCVFVLLAVALVLLQSTALAGENVRGCTRTRGYRANHNCYSPRDNQRISWPPVSPEDPCEMENAVFVCGIVGIKIYDLKESDAPVWTQLARQLLTASLNEADGASVPNQIDQDMTRAFDLLGQYCTSFADAPSAIRQEAEEIKTRLDVYNNGNAPNGPPHCDGNKEEPPCVMTEWGEWSECSTVCGNGTQTRTRMNCYSKYEPHIEAEVRPCNEQPCCEWSAWDPWSACSEPCEGGTRYRTRGETCIDDSAPETEEEWEDCNVNVGCCTTEDWSLWSECSEECGSGTQSRWRKTICINGTATSTEDESRSCNTEPCCQEDPWTQWSECSVACGGGIRNRTQIKTCLGQEPQTHVEEQVCNDCPCCVHSEWTEFTGCNATCGGGAKTRFRTKTCGFGMEGLSDYETDTMDCNEQPCCPDNCLECDGQGDCLQCDPYHYGPRCLPSVCVECIPNHYGVQCQPCPDDCPTTCDDGIEGSGACPSHTYH